MDMYITLEDGPPENIYKCSYSFQKTLVNDGTDISDETKWLKIQCLILTQIGYKIDKPDPSWCILKMPNIGTADGHSFTFHARVDIWGQGCDVLTEIDRRTKLPFALKMQLQERHTKGRIHLSLSSDHDEHFEIKIITKTPGQAPLSGYQMIGSKGLASWEYCCCMHRTVITCETVWEVWTTNKEVPLLLFTLSFEECDNNQEQVVAEDWADIDGIVDGSNVPSDCDTFYDQSAASVVVKSSSPKLIRKSGRQKVAMKKGGVRK